MRYNSPVTPGDKLREFFLSGGIPVTLAILAVNVLTFLASFLSRDVAAPFVQMYLQFVPPLALHAPWTFFTYPFASDGGFSLWLVVNWVFFWLSGGSLERSWGSGRYAVFFFALSAISAASFLLGEGLLHLIIPPPLYGAIFTLFLPLTGLVVAFCMLNPTQTVTLYFFPIQARWVALLVTALVYFQNGSLLGPAMGLFACGGILAAFLYVRFGRSWADIGSYGSPRFYTTPRRPPAGPDLRIYPPAKPAGRSALDGSPRRGPLDLAGRLKDWRERRRLEKLLRNSGFTEGEPRWRDDEERRRR